MKRGWSRSPKPSSDYVLSERREKAFWTVKEGPHVVR